MRADVSARGPTLTDIARSLPTPSLGQALRGQARIARALMIREIYTRFGRDNIGFAWIIAEPTIFCTAVILLWSASQHSGHAETPIVPFLITGYMPLLLFRHMTGRILRCMQGNGALLYHRQITVMALYSSRLAIELIGTSAAFLFCLVAFGALGFVEFPDEPSFMLGGWLLYCWYAAATALIVGGITERSEVAEKIWNPISYVLIPLSGAFYMVQWAPPALRESLVWLPSINGIEMIRAGYFGSAVTTYFHPVYLIYVNLLLTAFGLYIVKDARRYIEVE